EETDPILARLNQFQQGLSPLASLAWLLPSRENLRRGWGGKEPWEMPNALLGLLCWAGAGVLVWIGLNRRFRALTGRPAVRRPEGVPIAERQAAMPEPVQPVAGGQVGVYS